MNMAHRLLMGKDTAVTVFDRNRFRSADGSVRNLPQRQRVMPCGTIPGSPYPEPLEDEGARGYEVVNATMEV